MCRKVPTDQPPNREAPDQIPIGNHLGNLMRDYGEEYINTYKPYIQQIKLIRSMRICKTPALGGRVLVCNGCGKHNYIYHSCGHSHCPICQAIKREQWVDKLRAELYAVPYVHSVFTLPHQLNGLARKNQYEIYGLVMRVAWMTIKKLSLDKKNLGALPGMVGVLHTFGSDMKYHVHVHCLVTFGGLDNDGVWQFPKRKHKIAKYRKICGTYRELFLQELEKLYLKGKINYHIGFDELKKQVENIRWVVHNTRPTIDTKILENYLAKYINRVAISNNRLEYVRDLQQVNIIYNDYKNQKSGCPAPKEVKRLNPLVAILQFMQHVLPLYFQKSRRYGIHSSPTKKRLEDKIPDAIKRNGQAIRTLFEILTHLLQLNPFVCENCQSEQFEEIQLKPNKVWVHQYIIVPTQRPPPIKSYI